MSDGELAEQDGIHLNSVNAHNVGAVGITKKRADIERSRPAQDLLLILEV